MEQYRSTLATTAIAVVGLVTAAHVLHPGNYEEQPRRAQAMTAQVEAGPTSAWTDPPASSRLRAGVATAEVVALTPHMTMLLPPGMTMAPTLPAEMIVAARSQPIGVARQRKVAQRSNHEHQAALAHGQIPMAVPTSAAPQPTARGGGPLDHLLRGLGLARDSEG